jgi:hypothetical protein
MRKDTRWELDRKWMVENVENEVDDENEAEYCAVLRSWLFGGWMDEARNGK